MMRYCYILQPNNIAKANADNPSQRLTRYPGNDHILGKLQFDWLNTQVYWHGNKLLSRIERPNKRLNLLQNESFDWGVQLGDEFSYRGYSVNWRAGLDSRSGVKALERELDSSFGETVNRVNLDARQWESFAASELSKPVGLGIWLGGVRVSKQYQHDKKYDHTYQDINSSAFLGYVHHFNSNWQWAGYISQAYRTPSLTERYFDGSTPKGHNHRLSQFGDGRSCKCGNAHEL